MSAQYSEVHQAFLQMIVHRGAVEIVEAQQIFACIWKTYGTGEIETKFLEQTVQKINTRIANLDAKIVLYQYGLNQKIFWVYVNTAASSIDKYQTMYTDGDIAYFKLLMEEMADTARKLLLPTQVLNLTNKMSKGIAISKVRAQCCIDKWVEQGYFAKEDNKIYFGPKMLLEFKDQLLTNDPDTTVCSLCKDISIWGITCSGCDEKFHEHCIKKFLIHSKNCPSCKETWKQAD